MAAMAIQFGDHSAGKDDCIPLLIHCGQILKQECCVHDGNDGDVTAAVAQWPGHVISCPNGSEKEDVS